NLRGTCNYLISMASIFDSIHMAAHCFLFYVIVTGRNLVPLWQCFYVNALPIGGLISGEIVIFLIGVDRLISILAPSTHRSMRKPPYVFLMLCVCMLPSAFYVYLGYLNQLETPDQPVLCLIVEGVHGYLVAWFINFGMLINLATIACYITVFILVRRQAQGVDTMNKRIIKSLMWIMVVISGTWFATVTYCQIMEHFLDFSPPSKVISMTYSGIFINFGCSCNFFILYNCSAEYRRQLRRQLQTIFCGLVDFKSTSVNPTTFTRWNPNATKASETSKVENNLDASNVM
ncbi:Protein SRSX-32, partial [Aphelenchoides avenae]